MNLIYEKGLGQIFTTVQFKCMFIVLWVKFEVLLSKYIQEMNENVCLLIWPWNRNKVKKNWLGPARLFTIYIYMIQV